MFDYRQLAGRVRILTHKEGSEVDYPQAVTAAEQQESVFWFARELGVEKDENDIRTSCTEGERHGITEVLRIFSKYETMLGGQEFWGGKVKKMFPRPEIQRMSATFSYMELGVHEPFYMLINKTLNIATDSFSTSWKEDPVLKQRVEFINGFASSPCPLMSMAAFAFMEGAVLYSNFAFLKSFNTGGFNLIPHITAGIDAAAKDEGFHAMASAWLYNQTRLEMEEKGLLSEKDKQEISNAIMEIALTVYEHEKQIAEGIFSKGGIRTITKDELLGFVRNRIDTVLGFLNEAPLFGEPEGAVSEWFYNQLSSYKYADFFAAQQVQYVRDWAVHKLKFKGEQFD